MGSSDTFLIIVNSSTGVSVGPTQNSSSTFGFFGFSIKHTLSEYIGPGALFSITNIRM